MSRPKDSFDDAELTSLAKDIIQDFINKQHVDPNDSFICALANEIQEQFKANPSASSCTDSSLYTGNVIESISLSVNDSMLTSSSCSTQDPIMSPTIVSHNSNDTFNLSLPPIPSAKQTTKISNRFRANKQRTQFMSPHHPPPNRNRFSPRSLPKLSLNSSFSNTSDDSDHPPLILDDIPLSDVSRCMSPRHQTPKQRVSSIPDFSDSNHSVSNKRHKKELTPKKK